MKALLFVLCLMLTSCASVDFHEPRATVKYLSLDVDAQINIGSASAVEIAPGQFITAAHVFENSKVKVFVKTSKGLRLATLVKVDKEHDLAFFTADDTCPCATLGEMPQIDSPVVVIGYPYGTTIEVQFATEGRVQDFDDEKNFMVTSAQTAPGSSGGGVFQLQNGRWKLIGITKAIYGQDHPMPVPPGNIITYTHWISFSVTIQAVREFLIEIRKKISAL